MFRYRASFTKPTSLSTPIPPVRITSPNGHSIVSNDKHVSDYLSESFQRSVTLASPSSATVEFEGYIPEEIEELANRGTVFSRESPEDTFFDIAMIHVLTTATIPLHIFHPETHCKPSIKYSYRLTRDSLRHAS